MIDIKDSGDSWNTYSNKTQHGPCQTSNGNMIGLLFILAFVFGIACYIGSFYWDREPVPEISKKHKPTKLDTRCLPSPGFEKDYG